MTEQKIKDEHDRLRPIVFEGAPDWFKWAVRDFQEGWMWNVNKPKSNLIGWQSKTAFVSCKNQPKTTLGWTNTLIRR